MQPIPPLPTSEEVLVQLGPVAGLPALLLAFLCVFVMVTLRDWRAVVAAFMGLSICLALLIARVLPPEWALLRVIVGGMIAIMWYLSAQRAGWGGGFLPFRTRTGVNARPLSSTTAFRVLAASTLAIILLGLQPRLPLPAIGGDLRLATTWLVAYALLGLALGDEALQVGAALLIAMSASQLVVSALSRDPWLIWLLSAVELLVGLATAYLMIARGPLPDRRPSGDRD
jgi:hypothetical protein